LKKHKIDNKGFTLIETTVCFILLGILLVAAAQVISSSSEVYYYSKSISYGVQAAQVIATEIRGELEDAVIKKLDFTADSSIPAEADGKCIHISLDKKSIYFINSAGEQVGYSLQLDSSPGATDKVLVRNAVKIYDEYFGDAVAGDAIDVKKYTSQYVGMNYKVKDISFTPFNKAANMPTSGTQLTGAIDFPVIVMELTVTNPQYGDYTCTEYIALYNFYNAEHLVSD